MPLTELAEVRENIAKAEKMLADLDEQIARKQIEKDSAQVSRLTQMREMMAQSLATYRNDLAMRERSGLS